MIELSHEDATYQKIVSETILHRFRAIMLFGVTLYLIFWYLDRLVYPGFSREFLYIRLSVSCFIIAAYALSWIGAVKARLLWLADAVILASGGGIIAMIYVSDGSLSRYYEGINLVFLGMVSINAFSVSHNLVVGLVLLGAYAAAVMINPQRVNPTLLSAALFFMGSTLAFVVMMTRLYGRQHYKEYTKSLELAVNARQLDQANRKLIETEKLKDQFFANVSHELRTPLALILGPVRKHLAHRDEDSELTRDLLTVERNASLLLKHVNDLLDVAKIDAGVTGVNYTKADGSRVLRFIASHFEAIAQEKRIKFSVEAPPACECELDIQKIQQVLFNVLANAFKFTPSGGQVSCELKPCDSHLEFLVHDDGPGIPKDQRSVIFDRFRQGEGGDTRRFGGTGLGLAIAREFVEMHFGTITVEDSSWLTGATFVIRLPAKAQPGVMVLPEPSQLKGDWLASVALSVSDQNIEKSSGGFVALTGAPHVLVVEDSPEMNRFIAEALSADYRVTRAFDGKDGLKKAVALHPDLILTDLMMPEMSGEELVQACRAVPDLAQTPIVLLTAKADEALRTKLLTSGAQDYLYKPFSVPELRARVRNLVSMKRTRDVLEAELSTSSEDLAALAKALGESKKTTEDALVAAQEAGRLKDEFLMILSHELRTPLTAILGWSDLLRSGDVDTEEFTTGLETIERNARSQLRLVNDLLDLSRIIKGKLQLERDSVELREVVELSIQSVEAAARAKEITLEAYYENMPLIVQGDRDRLQQVVWNILSNAVKFTPKGGTIGALLRGEGENAVIEVSDSGEGIDPEFLPQIFERLRQADSSTSRRHGGLGLGLSIARHLIEMHGGILAARSDGRDKGSVFTIKLPLAVRSRHGALSANGLHSKHLPGS